MGINLSFIMTKGKKRISSVSQAENFLLIERFDVENNSVFIFLGIEKLSYSLFSKWQKQPNFKIENSNIMNNIAAGIL